MIVLNPRFVLLFRVEHALAWLQHVAVEVCVVIIFTIFIETKFFFFTRAKIKWFDNLSLSTPAVIVSFQLCKVLSLQALSSDVKIRHGKCHPKIFPNLRIFKSLIKVSVLSWEDKIV